MTAQKPRGSVSRVLAAGGTTVALVIQVLPDVLLAVVIGQLLKGRDVLGSKQADLGHVGVAVVAEHRLHVQVGVAAVVDVAGHAPDLAAIHVELRYLVPVMTKPFHVQKFSIAVNARTMHCSTEIYSANKNMSLH